jgi:TfoX/Sxy family transcriptional regulator of competence genes
MMMTKVFQERLCSLLDGIGFGHDLDVQVKSFFGGAAAYVKGHMCLSLTNGGLAVKLSAVDRQELLQVKGARKLQYFPNAPIKKEYVVLPDDMVNDSDTLRQWVIKSMCYVIAVSNTEHGSSLPSSTG